MIVSDLKLGQQSFEVLDTDSLAGEVWLSRACKSNTLLHTLENLIRCENVLTPLDARQERHHPNRENLL